MQPAREPPISAEPDRLTWNEIRARFPNQWAVLVDFEWIDELNNQFRAATVLHHGTGRDATLREAAPSRRGYRDFAHYHTGRVRGLWQVEYLPQ